MAKGRTVAVRITADTKGFVAGVTKAEVNLTNLRKTAVAGTTVLAKLAATAAGAGVGALTALYARTAPLIDQQAKLADQFNLSTEALAGMDLQFRLMGSNSDKLKDVLKDMSKNLGDAAIQGGTAEKKFSNLNLQVSELVGMSADKQFSEISDAIRGLKTASEQASAANQIFGESGIQVLNIIRQGSSGLEEARRKAEAYGTAISRVDAAKVEAANDAWTEAQEVTRGLANRITVQLAPVVEGIIDLYKESSLESRGFTDTVQTGFNMGVKAVGFFADAMQGLRVVIKGIELAIAAMMAMGLKSWDTLFTGLAKGIDFALGSINDLTSKINKTFKTDIPNISFSAQDSGFVKAINEMSDIAGIQIQELALDLQNLAMQEMPSDKIEAFVAKVQEASQKTAEAVAASRKSMFEGSDDPGADKKLEEDLEKFRQFHLSRETAEIESLHRSLQELQKFHDAGLVGTGQFWTKSAQITTKTLANMTASVANHSKKAFELNKKLSIVNAIINTYEMATAAYKALAGIPYVGPVLGAAAAAAAIKFGQMQVQGIKSAQFGGGTAPSAANTPAPATSPVGGGAAAQQTVILQGLRPGELVSSDAVIAAFNEASKNGARVVIPNNAVYV